MTAPLPFVRAAAIGDLEPLLDIANSIGGALASLPADTARLAELIEASSRAFEEPVTAPGPEHYLFVLEDRGNVLGAATLVARVGGYEPFYTYERVTETSAHPPLGMERSLDVLHLRGIHKGPSELAGLALHPSARGRGLGRLLSLSRLLYVAAHRERFADHLIAELQGIQDRLGRSPFWDWVGRKFFAREFAEVDFLCGLGHKEFIADLMPPHPIYVDLLPDEVRAAIGACHVDALPALELLQREGLEHAGQVDIFDAGPILDAPIDAIRTVSIAQYGHVAGRAADAGPRQLVATLDGFRSCLSTVSSAGGGAAALPGPVLETLGLEAGVELVWAPAGQGAAITRATAGDSAPASS